MQKFLFRPIIGEYDYIGEFREGLAFVRNNCEEFKVGFIDRTGRVVVPMIYYGRYGHEIFVHYPFFNEGLAPLINKDGKFGYVDKKGKIIIPFEYDFTYLFVEGLAAVKKDNKWGFIDKTGDVVIPLEYDSVGTGTFHGGQEAVMKNGKWGYIDKSGMVITPFTLECTDIFVERDVANIKSNTPSSTDYELLGSYYEGLSVVKKGMKYGYIDRTEKIIIPIEYDWATCFNEGLAAVQKDGVWSILEIITDDIKKP